MLGTRKGSLTLSAPGNADAPAPACARLIDWCALAHAASEHQTCAASSTWWVHFRLLKL